jgi:hypothetical protein
VVVVAAIEESSQSRLHVYGDVEVNAVEDEGVCGAIVVGKEEKEPVSSATHMGHGYAATNYSRK